MSDRQVAALRERIQLAGSMRWWPATAGRSIGTLAAIGVLALALLLPGCSAEKYHVQEREYTVLALAGAGTFAFALLALSVILLVTLRDREVGSPIYSPRLLKRDLPARPASPSPSEPVPADPPAARGDEASPAENAP